MTRKTPTTSRPAGRRTAGGRPLGPTLRALPALGLAAAALAAAGVAPAAAAGARTPSLSLHQFQRHATVECVSMMVKLEPVLKSELASLSSGEPVPSAVYGQFEHILRQGDSRLSRLRPPRAFQARWRRYVQLLGRFANMVKPLQAIAEQHDAARALKLGASLLDDAEQMGRIAAQLGVPICGVGESGSSGGGYPATEEPRSAPTPPEGTTEGAPAESPEAPEEEGAGLDD
ncbi:MAG TPA: hypothetical protein VGY13_00920 [Solirubrobacteraceae bacterium]|jgi:hypothetical protein|nr:hypothetical protein [Solirubrobacteraceae bacterium]